VTGRVRPGPVPSAELAHFLDTFLYGPEAFLVDEIVRVDREAGAIEARLDTARPLPYSDAQRVRPEHPAHVSAGELLMATGSLGCLHAWLFHGCRWDEGWTGFGNRIHRADFRGLVRRGPPLVLHSRETRRRVGPRRVVLRFEFRFEQEGALAYLGDQSAMFFRGLPGAEAAPDDEDG
jgi:hypothetical protein